MAPITIESFTSGYYYKANNIDVLDLLINRNIHIAKEKHFRKLHLSSRTVLPRNITCRVFDMSFVAIFLEELSYFSKICCISLHQYFTCLHKVINCLFFRATLTKTGINIFLWGWRGVGRGERNVEILVYKSPHGSCLHMKCFGNKYWTSIQMRISSKFRSYLYLKKLLWRLSLF